MFLNNIYSTKFLKFIFRFVTLKSNSYGHQHHIIMSGKLSLNKEIDCTNSVDFFSYADEFLIMLSSKELGFLKTNS